MFYSSIFLLIVMNLLTASLYGSGKPVRVLGAGEGSGFMSAYHQTEGTSVKLFCDTTYILTGLYYVDSLATLEIQQGVTILGDSATGGTLIVQRGGQIFAEGSVEHPILFTGRKPAGERVPGDWGGIIIAGSATSNQSSDNGMLAGLGVAFGGANDEYSAGHFHYVRVEYAGMELLPSHSGAGVTLAGLGKETELHHIQVSYSKGNGVNIFGGTTDIPFLVTLGNASDDIRASYGYSGNMQFIFSLKDSSNLNTTGASNGLHSSNDHLRSSSLPKTSAVVSNATMIGVQYDTAISISSLTDDATAILFSGNTAMSVYNSVALGYPLGVAVRHDSTISNIQNDELQVINLSLQAKIALHTDSAFMPFSIEDWFNVGEKKNYSSAGREPSSLALVAPFFVTECDPRPQPGSEADTAGTEYSNPKLQAVFFEQVMYRGAFDPLLPLSEQWIAGWTEFNPQEFDRDADLDVEVSYLAGWNMLSVPLKYAQDSTPSFFYPSAVGNAFVFDNGYTNAEALYPGQGFWMKFGADGIQSVAGKSCICRQVVETQPGWNIIGGISDHLHTDDIMSEPEVNITSLFFGYSPSTGYTPVDELIAGKGYWVKTAEAGTLTMEFNLEEEHDPEGLKKILNNSSVVTFNDVLGRKQSLYISPEFIPERELSRFELPPAPPVGIFSARYSSQRMLVSTSNGAISFPVEIQSAAYPVTIVFEQRDRSLTNVEVVEMKNNRVVNRHRLQQNGVVTLRDPEARVAIRKSTGESLPSEYALYRAYPNPFNPVTNIEYSLPEMSHVEIKVYNTLGSEVAVLRNEVQPAGKQSIQWNAVNIPSGVYFIRMKAGRQQFMEKIILSK